MVKNIFKILTYILWMIPSLLLLGFIALVSWILGLVLTAFFGIPIVITFILSMVLISISLLSSLLKPNASGAYSPVAHFFLGWLLGKVMK